MSGAGQRSVKSTAIFQLRCALTLAAVALLVCFLIDASASAAATHGVRPVVTTGTDLLPGSDAVRFSIFGVPSLNNRGEVAFASELTGDVTSLSDTGLWIATDSGFETVAREGDTPPGYPAGSAFGAFVVTISNGVPLNDAGNVAFTNSAVTVTPAVTSGIWTGDGDQLDLVAKQGDPAPGATSGATFSTFFVPRPTLNSSGTVAFQTGLSAPYFQGNNGADGTWRAPAGGAPEPLALISENAVGLGEAATFVDFRSLNSPMPINRAGTVGLSAAYSLTGSSTLSNGVGLWAESGTDPELRAWALTPAPQFGPSATVSVTAIGGIDSTGNIAFNGNFAGGTVGGGIGGIIGVAGADGLHVVAYQDGPAPGAGVGHIFSSSAFRYEPTINSSGQVAFYGSEYDGTNSGTTRSGVWAGAPGALEMVAREGDLAPGTGLNFSNFIRATPAMNRFGQVAFANTLSAAPSGTSSTLWATDIDGELALIARSGDTIEVAPGDLRTIQSLSMLTFHGDDDGKPRGFNDLGQVAFWASFVSGTSGVFVSNLVAHLPGDYNGNGTVDAADYTVWRDGVEAQNHAADGTRDGSVDDEDYALWKEYFGRSLESGAASVAGINAPVPVPEPSLCPLLLSAATISWASRGPRRASRLRSS